MWQEYPVCKGSGVDPHTKLSDTFFPTCYVCNGRRIIDELTGYSTNNQNENKIPNNHMKNYMDDNKFNIKKIGSFECYQHKDSGVRCLVNHFNGRQCKLCSICHLWYE